MLNDFCCVLLCALKIQFKQNSTRKKQKKIQVPSTFILQCTYGSVFNLDARFFSVNFQWPLCAGFFRRIKRRKSLVCNLCETKFFVITISPEDIFWPHLINDLICTQRRKCLPASNKKVRCASLKFELWQVCVRARRLWPLKILFFELFFK